MPHRLGQIIACPAVLKAIPRTALIEAIKRHATDGRLVSDHHHAGRRFRLQTDDERQKTTIRLHD